MMLGLGLDDNHLDPRHIYNTPHQNNNMFASGASNKFNTGAYNNRNTGSSYNMQNYGVLPLASPQSRMEADAGKKMIMAI